MGCAGSKDTPAAAAGADKENDAAAAEIQAAAQLYLKNQVSKPDPKDEAAEDLQSMATDLLAKQDPEFRKAESAADFQDAAMAFLKAKQEEQAKASVAA